MKNFQKSSKIASKTQNFGITRANWAKPLFIQVSVTPNRVESGEISHAPKSLLHSVINIVQLSHKLNLNISSFQPQNDLRIVSNICLLGENSNSLNEHMIYATLTLFSLLLISHKFLNTKLLDDMGTIFGFKGADQILDQALQVIFSFWFKRDYFLFLRILIVKVQSVY